VSELAAEVSSLVPGRRVDDNAHVLLRFADGARGHLWASQVAVGRTNALRLSVHGTEGGLDWDQETPETLWFTPRGQPRQMLTRGGPGAGAAADRLTRTPAGHPEGYLEAFANLYAEAARAIRAHRSGRTEPDVQIPTLSDGLRGMRFIAACQTSSTTNAAWVALAP
jgi:predicted dehydrogenase